MSYKIKQATNLQGMTGAIGGTFYPNDLAEKIFVKPLEYGSVFAYLFRRFGYPIHGWDSDKDICSYTYTRLGILHLAEEIHDLCYDGDVPGWIPRDITLLHLLLQQFFATQNITV